MSTWDEAKLREVVSRKGNPKATTDIVCKHFLAAVETGKYGWFWECPDGGDKCKYRHALPPGFVLKSQKKKDEEDAKNQEISLEEFLEVEVNVVSLCTPSEGSRAVIADFDYEKSPFLSASQIGS